jgi:hypothetical protein
MPWGRLDDNASGNGKLLALSDAAFRMWAMGLVYCQRNLTDGFIPAHAIDAFGVRASNKRRVADELCTPQMADRASVWRKTEGGYQVHDYLDWNDSRADVLKARADSRRRVRKFRGGEEDDLGKCNAAPPPLPEALPIPLRHGLPVVVVVEQEKEEKRKEDEAVQLARFDRFMTLYPRPEQREPARMLWLAMAPSAAVAAEILASLEAHRLTKRWQDAVSAKDCSFLPLAKTFLRDRHWMERPPPGVPTDQAAGCDRGHTPPCEDAVACTARYLAELRDTETSTSFPIGATA